jgi:hypothetical protein
MSYSQPYVGKFLISSNSTGIFPVEIVASHYSIMGMREVNNSFIVKGDKEKLSGWSRLQEELYVVNKKYLVGPDTPLMRELL